MIAKFISLYFNLFVLEEKINANKKAKKIADAMPPAALFSPPVSTPKKPSAFAPSIAPFASVEPNPIIGTLAPAFANSLKYGYTPTVSSIIPITKNNTKMRAVVILVLTTKICARAQISPPTRKDIK